MIINRYQLLVRMGLSFHKEVSQLIKLVRVKENHSLFEHDTNMASMVKELLIE